MFLYTQSCRCFVRPCALLITLPVASTFAEVITVDDDGKADFASIQAAVDYASDGDEILVAPGVYTSDHPAHVVDLLGKAITLRSSDGPEVTFIDGEGVRRGIACFNGETANTHIEGFTIRNGFGVGYDYDGNGQIFGLEQTGGGMYNDQSNPTLINCTFINNSSPYNGGGMSNNKSSPTLTNCRFSDNTDDRVGGGMYNYQSSPTLFNCAFANNSSASYGGGMYNSYSSPTLENCTFINNSAGIYGGGISNWHSSPILTNTTVCENTPDQIYGDWTDNGDNTVRDVCISDCFFDFNGDGVVDGYELTFILGAWGTDDPVADLNSDGVVDGLDLTIILASWGECP